jgi:hypothetical protein
MGQYAQVSRWVDSCVLWCSPQLSVSLATLSAFLLVIVIAMELRPQFNDPPSPPVSNVQHGTRGHVEDMDKTEPIT